MSFSSSLVRILLIGQIVTGTGSREREREEGSGQHSNGVVVASRGSRITREQKEKETKKGRAEMGGGAKKRSSRQRWEQM
jgi:hypothetical protein